MRLFHWLAALGNALLAEIPPPKKQRPTIALVTPELSPNEKEIIARAEESFQLIETQSQAVLERIRETPVISPAPDPVTLVEVPEILEVLEVPTISDQAEAEQPPAEVATNRKQLVEGLLDEAWQQGLRTYAQLMKYIELQTGKSCSKRVISGWKQSRQLTEAA